MHAYMAFMQAAGLNNNKNIYTGYKVVYVLITESLDDDLTKMQKFILRTKEPD
jgi:hypothetical protein